MKRTKTIKLTRREVSLIRCLVYPALRNADISFIKEYCTLLNKLERLWKDTLYNGLGEEYNTKRKRK